MPKPAKSQWDFGDLFPPEATRKVWTVAELTRRIRQLIEQQLGSVWIEGEVTNCRAQSSGHIYFSLKDATAQVSCVLFRGELASNREHIKDGQKIIVQGDFTVYEPRGQYQVIIRAIELQGLGALQEAFQRLKQKLQAEGLFDPQRKRALPRFPEQIGVVSSPTGAALHDVLHVIERRQPGLRIVLAPCRVQGAGAGEEIANAIRLLNQWRVAKPLERRLDLILVTRGGGSMEDLWAFNEEVVARAVAASEVPIVSAVGHEIDFTICDFAADLRAATPSAAAEMITESAFSACQLIDQAGQILTARIRRRLEFENRRFRQVAQRLARSHPRRRLQDQMQRLDEASERIRSALRRQWRDHRNRWQNLQLRLGRVRLNQQLQLRRQQLAQADRRLSEQFAWRLHKIHQRFNQAQDRLHLLSPLQVLSRGYSITMDASTGAILRSADEATSGQLLKTRLAGGEVHSIVR